MYNILRRFCGGPAAPDSSMNLVATPHHTNKLAYAEAAINILTTLMNFHLPLPPLNTNL